MIKLENLFIDSTKQLPEISFETNGKLRIAGRALPDNAVPFFQSLGDWLDLLDCREVIFDIELEYINTTSSMQLFSLLRKLELNDSIENITINWHYEEDDEDHYDTGLFFEEKLERTAFQYTEHAA